ncbi:MAG: HNH endonuclease [Candidatus Dormibacteria bacterium]
MILLPNRESSGYVITETGCVVRVENCQRKTKDPKCQIGYVCKPQPNGSGYFLVAFHWQEDGMKQPRYQPLIHRLVATAFVANKRDPKIYNEIDHKDKTPSNNHYKNLQWVSRKENGHHSGNKGASRQLLDNIAADYKLGMPKTRLALKYKITSKNITTNLRYLEKVLVVEQMLARNATDKEIRKVFHVKQYGCNRLKLLAGWIRPSYIRKTPKQISTKMKAVWANYTPAQYKKRVINHAKAIQVWYNSLTATQKKERQYKITKGVIAHYKSS